MLLLNWILILIGTKKKGIRDNHLIIKAVYEEHSNMPEMDFVNDTGSIRLSTTRYDISTEASVFHDITRKQMETIEDCVCLDQYDGFRGFIFFDCVAGTNVIHAGEFGEDDPDDCFDLTYQLGKEFKKAQSMYANRLSLE